MCKVKIQCSHIDATLRPLDWYPRRKALHCRGQLIYAQSGVSAYSKIDNNKRPRVLNLQTYSRDNMIHHIATWQCRDSLYITHDLQSHSFIGGKLSQIYPKFKSTKRSATTQSYPYNPHTTMFSGGVLQGKRIQDFCTALWGNYEYEL